MIVERALRRMSRIRHWARNFRRQGVYAMCDACDMRETRLGTHTATCVRGQVSEIVSENVRRADGVSLTIVAGTEVSWRTFLGAFTDASQSEHDTARLICQRCGSCRVPGGARCVTMQHYLNTETNYARSE